MAGRCALHSDNLSLYSQAQTQVAANYYFSLATTQELEVRKTMPFTPTYEVPAERTPYTFYANEKASHGRVGCLMLHGFMGSPGSSRPMARYLATNGITVHCPLLPGHGQYPDKLYNVSHRDWLAEAEEALTCLRHLCDEVFIVGHSMGTVLGAYLITKYANVRGMVMLTPLYDVPDNRLRVMRFLRYVMPWFYPHKRKSMQVLLRQRVLDFDPTLDFDSPAVQRQLPEITRLPTSGLAEMVKIVDIGRTLWPRLTLPILMFQGGHDPAVPPGSIEKIYNLLPSQDKHLESFPEAGHELMRPFEPAHTTVWQLIHHFIGQHSKMGLMATFKSE
jgi:carboxylesterase